MIIRGFQRSFRIPIAYNIELNARSSSKPQCVRVNRRGKKSHILGKNRRNITLILSNSVKRQTQFDIQTKYFFFFTIHCNVSSSNIIFYDIISSQWKYFWYVAFDILFIVEEDIRSKRYHIRCIVLCIVMSLCLKRGLILVWNKIQYMNTDHMTQWFFKSFLFTIPLNTLYSRR